MEPMTSMAKSQNSELVNITGVSFTAALKSDNYVLYSQTEVTF